MNFFYRTKVDKQMLCSHHCAMNDAVRKLSIASIIDTLEVKEQIADYEELNTKKSHVLARSVFAGCIALCTSVLVFLTKKLAFFQKILQKVRDRIKPLTVNSNERFTQFFAKASNYLCPPIINRLVNQAISSVFGEENRAATQPNQQTVSASQTTPAVQPTSNSSTPFCRKGNPNNLSFSQNLTLRKIERLTNKIGLLINEIEYVSEGTAQFNYSGEWLDLTAQLNRYQYQLTTAQKTELLRIATTCRNGFQTYIQKIKPETVN